MQKYRRIAWFVLALVLLAACQLVLPSLLGDATGVVMAAGPIVTNLGEKNTPSEHKVRDVSDALSVLDPSRFPFDTMLRRLKGRRQKATAIKVEWASTERLPRLDTAATGSAAGAAGAAQTITPAAPGMWRKEDLIKLVDQPTAPLLIVESVDTGAGTISVRALGAASYGTVPAIALGHKLARLGNSKTENFKPSDSRIIIPEYANNLVHAFDAVVRVSGHRKATKNYTTTQDWSRARADNLYDFRKSLEYNYLWGQLSEIQDATSQEWRWTMNGVTRYINQTIDYSIGNLTESQLIDINAQIFTQNDGAFTRMLFADSVLAGDLDKVLLARMQHSETRKIAGVEFTELRTRFGRLLIAYHPGLDELGFVSYGIVIDMNNIEKVELEALDKIVLKLRETGQGDSDAEQYTEKSTVVVKKPNTHFIIRGS